MTRFSLRNEESTLSSCSNPSLVGVRKCVVSLLGARARVGRPRSINAHVISSHSCICRLSSRLSLPLSLSLPPLSKSICLLLWLPLVCECNCVAHVRARTLAIQFDDYTIKDHIDRLVSIYAKSNDRRHRIASRHQSSPRQYNEKRNIYPTWRPGQFLEILRDQISIDQTAFLPITL